MKGVTEIEKMVYEKYPISEKERNCRVEKDKRNWLRAEYRKQLIEKETKSNIVDKHQPKV